MSSSHSEIPYSTAIGNHMVAWFQRNARGEEQWAVMVAGTSPEDCAARLKGQLNRDVVANSGITERSSIIDYYDSGDHEGPMRMRDERGFHPLAMFDFDVNRPYFPNADSETGRLVVEAIDPEEDLG